MVSAFCHLAVKPLKLLGMEQSVQSYCLLIILKRRSWLALSKNFLHFLQIVVACRLNPCKVRYLKVKQNNFSADECVLHMENCRNE